MRKLITYLVLLGVLGGAMYATNPDKQEFSEFVQGRMEKRLDKESSEGLGEALNDVISAMGAKFSQSLTTREDWYVCSLFTVKMPKRDYRYLGVFHMFILLQTENPLEPKDS
ncbi:MAG: DUF4359 domain-containing protein [Flavobacteriales bacterium]|nr:DUF4359 domain-containing protein [Flavobacteriales bacterium]